MLDQAVYRVCQPCTQPGNNTSSQMHSGGQGLEVVDDKQLHFTAQWFCVPLPHAGIEARQL